MGLFHYLTKFQALNPNRTNGHSRPHKMCLLLAVMDLMEQGAITDNRFEYSDELKQAFSKRFSQFSKSNDKNNPFLPFYHLRTSGFWHHRTRPGRDAMYRSLKDSTTERKVKESIQFAYVDDELYEYFRSPIARQLLTMALAENFDSDIREQLLTPTADWSWGECELIVNDYLTMLAQELEGESYNKAEHIRVLRKALPNRSKVEIEHEYQNISAILQQMGLPSIDGYKPLFNYQRQILPDVVGPPLLLTSPF